MTIAHSAIPTSSTSPEAPEAQPAAGAPAPVPLEALHGRRADLVPPMVIAGLALLALPLVGSFPTWVTLTLAGLAMGMMLFIMASGLTLVFGLMDVMNLGHASFVAVGAYVAATLAPIVVGFVGTGSTVSALSGMALTALGAMVATAALGLVFERLFIRPVYGDHLKQILITIGAMIIIEQLLLALWGPQQMNLPLPEAVRDSFLVGEIAFERYRLVAVVIGLVLYIGLVLLFNRSRIGLLIRAGVENREMVEALGYRIDVVFIGVFLAGAALAGLGGTMWGFYREQFTAAIGADLLVQMLIIVVIGGLGSVRGCFIGALMLGLMQNYVGYLVPDLALVSNILVMAAVLLWRPRGMYIAGR